MPTVSCSGPFLSTRISKNANSLVLRAIFAFENCKNVNSLVLRAIFASESCENANSLVLWACFGASGNLWVPLARKIRNMSLKTKAPVDYSLRMERLLFRLGWVEGLWKPPGAFGSLWEPSGAFDQKDRKYDPQNGGSCRLHSSYGTATF
jgi:hypothetical protein